MLHALVVWLAFLASVHLARLFLFPAFGLVGGMAIGFVAVYGGILWFLMVHVGGLSARDLGITLRNWPTEVMLGVAGFFGISVLLLGWGLVIDGADAMTDVLRRIADYTLADRVKFLIIGLLAASCEDTLFRGYIQPALMARLGALTGLLLTIALFAVHHFVDWPTVSRMGSLFITGLGFGVLRWQKRPVIASYTAHTVLWLIWGDA
ncbi:CPBP family glutamic-type intramembrane protease [Haliangium sp.]|uniref:CPBP family glutamic-type intramembrane protease n=1 Tax=Haliangium sp. TaxID=2663208 RepID=UPI003D1438F2